MSNQIIAITEIIIYEVDIYGNKFMGIKKWQSFVSFLCILFCFASIPWKHRMNFFIFCFCFAQIHIQQQNL